MSDSGTPPARSPAPDPEAEGKGLLVVDLLSLPRRFSYRRYREDIVGFLAACAVVAALIAVALACAAIGAP